MAKCIPTTDEVLSYTLIQKIKDLNNSRALACLLTGRPNTVKTPVIAKLCYRCNAITRKLINKYNKNKKVSADTDGAYHKRYMGRGKS